VVRAEGNAQHRSLPNKVRAAREEKPAATFHILRHTYASALAMRGAPMHVRHRGATWSCRHKDDGKAPRAEPCGGNSARRAASPGHRRKIERSRDDKAIDARPTTRGRE
jgi:hypothetical protein